MLSLQPHIRRIPRLIRLRPPNNVARFSNPRPFTSNSQLLLITAPANRPQLPFLYTSSASGHPLFPGRALNVVTLGRHVTRLISTERRRKITNGIKIGLTVYAIILLLYVAQQGLYQETIERMFPTPPEWSWKSRWYLRTAMALQSPEKMGRVATSWPGVGSYYRELLARLEDPEIDGKGLKERIINAGEGEAILIDGVGRGGYDIEGMSEPWKKGYFECLMGAAETAEKLDGWLEDTVTHIASPPEYVVGPSNPRPKQGPKGSIAPLEENCVPAYQSPSVFYMKILTTKGFQTNQKLDAALAYADWLDYKGLKDTAGEVYRWAMDIAVEGLSVDPQKVVDPKTGILKDGGNKYVTENLLRTSKAMGVHQVRTGDITSALAVFLSVLKSRRSVTASEDSLPKAGSSRQDKSKTKKNDAITAISSFISPPPYPIPVRTGNEPPVRSQSSACEEAGLMVYIGEIIYASSSQETGLTWTRDAVDQAEIALLQLDALQEQKRLAASPSHGMQYQSMEEQCQHCLRSGLKNWKQMVRSLVVKAEKEELKAMDEVNNYWFGRGPKKVAEKQTQRRRWEAEEMILGDRAKRIQRLIGDDGFSALTSGDRVFFG
ncbi:hypothetical protein McanCB56680_004716 [Microsporum canis]|uniref:MFS maltose permease n=1 Tax=Arthroderma otae (strain ATCC MYA-4605 / CBS 113480) TaxID=554155 RepID=C5FZI7_ARTOC|nr:conserved hypothetical protein [Microsporum canis CBS 113480]EEQ35290.1 conserved hypothetical protein [Microsporum canis CBS 113480]